MLDSLFKPKAVAIIGASTKELSIGNVIIKNLQHYGYKGTIYPINPSAPEVRGLKAYPALSEVPGEVDLAHIIIPAPMVPQAMEECGLKGVKAAVINSAGFSELGEEGARIQEDFLAVAKKYGVRVFGPNCQGIINTDPELKAYCNFTFTYPKPGGISVVALSGGVGALIMQALFDLGVGMRMYASNGNACDLSISEILRYYGQDPGTRAIVLYTEGFADPQEFLETAREVARQKPILAMKAGRTEQGAKAASSHTGSLAGVDIATELIFEKTGILSFHDEEAMARASMAFATQPIPAGKRVGIITNTGGPAVIATDVLVAAGLEVPKLPEATIAMLKATQMPEAALENPIDVIATAGGPQFRAALDILLDGNDVDSIYLNFVTAPFTDTHGVAREIAAVSRLARKPIVCNFMTDLSQERYQETHRILQDGGVPCYANPTAAAHALVALVKYGGLRQREIGTPDRFQNVFPGRVTMMLDQARAAGRTVLSAFEVYSILEAYGIPVADWAVVESAEAAVEAAARIGYPVVLKVDAEALDHKSDAGGVAINVKDAEAVRSTVQEMQTRLGASAGSPREQRGSGGTSRVERAGGPPGEDRGAQQFLVQAFLPGDRELIVGASGSRGLGHLLMFGLGGIHVEILKDVVFKIAPITRVEAQEMLAGIRTSALLDGVRGQKGVHKAAVIEVLQRVSQLLTDFPMIEEMDLNPLMAFEDAVVAVDGRIRIKKDAD